MASEKSTNNRDLLSGVVNGFLAPLTSTLDNQTTRQLSSTNVVSETIGGTVEQRLQALFPQCGERSGLQQGGRAVNNRDLNFRCDFFYQISPVSDVYPIQNKSNCPCADIPFCSNTTRPWYNL